MDLVKELKNKGVLKFGSFALRSGSRTNYYCDIKEALGDPRLLSHFTNELVKIVPTNATCIAGSGYGGITLSSLVAYKLKLPLVLVRDKVKDHGTKKLIDGYRPRAKDWICIVDDVFTAGTSIKETRDKLKLTKANFVKPIVVLDRSNKNKVLSLVKGKDLI